MPKEQIITATCLECGNTVEIAKEFRYLYINDTSVKYCNKCKIPTLNKIEIKG